MMHPVFRVAPVNPAPLAAIVENTPGLRLLLLNSLSVLRGAALQKVIQAGDVSVDLSTREGAGGVASLLEEVPQERVLFGSHALASILRSALLKLKESAVTPAPTAGGAGAERASFGSGTALTSRIQVLAHQQDYVYDPPKIPFSRRQFLAATSVPWGPPTFTARRRLQPNPPPPLPRSSHLRGPRAVHWPPATAGPLG